MSRTGCNTNGCLCDSDNLNNEIQDVGQLASNACSNNDDEAVATSFLKAYCSEEETQGSTGIPSPTSGTGPEQQISISLTTANVAGPTDSPKTKGDVEDKTGLEVGEWVGIGVGILTFFVTVMALYVTYKNGKWKLPFRRSTHRIRYSENITELGQWKSWNQRWYQLDLSTTQQGVILNRVHCIGTRIVSFGRLVSGSWHCRSWIWTRRGQQ